MDARLKELLTDERNGSHGASERRTVAEFILEALDAEDGESEAAALCDSLADAAADLAIRIRIRQLCKQATRPTP